MAPDCYTVNKGGGCMKKHNGIFIFGVVSAVWLGICQLLHLPCTVAMAAEQWKTGWGFGTNMDLAVLYPWMVEVLSLPAALCAAVFLILSLRRRPGRDLVILNAAMLAALLLQGLLTNLFMWS